MPFPAKTNPCGLIPQCCRTAGLLTELQTLRVSCWIPAVTVAGFPREGFDLTHYTLRVWAVAVLHELPRNVSLLHTGARVRVRGSNQPVGPQVWFAEVVCVVFEVFFPPGVMEGCLMDCVVGPASGVVQLGTEHICCPGLVLAGAEDGSPARAEATVRHSLCLNLEALPRLHLLEDQMWKPG